MISNNSGPIKDLAPGELQNTASSTQVLTTIPLLSCKDLLYYSSGIRNNESQRSSHKGQHLHLYGISFKLKVVNFAKLNGNSKSARTFATCEENV